MMSRFRLVLVTCLALACLAFADPPRYGEWSAPANVNDYNGSIAPGAAGVNWPGKTDQTSSLSRDGLTLYFASGRENSMDIYVSHRASIDDPWGTPERLGEAINDDTAVEMMPLLSPDGHRLYFSSNRAGGFGEHDIYVSRRHDTAADFGESGWGPAENLGPVVNSALRDQSGSFFEDLTTGSTILYLSRVWATGSDIYACTFLPDGTFTTPVPVDSLNTAFNDQFPSVRRDGLEVVFASNRPGSIGDLDLWFATRATTADEWSEPQPLTSMNGPYIENRPRLSFDGSELYFTSTRPQEPPVPGAQQELYVATRSRLRGRE